MATSHRDPRELGGAWRTHQQHSFTPPSSDLAAFVAGFWTVEWAYDSPYQQKIVPYPQVQLTSHNEAAPELHGVSTRHVSRLLEGRGRVIGAAFRPGKFRSILGRSVSLITDRTMPASEVSVLQPVRVSVAAVADFEHWLLARLPTPDPAGHQASEIVDLVRGDPSISRVDGLAVAAKISVRTLQRLCAEHVGVGPKWLIRRYRLHEVTQRLDAGAPVDWAALAAELGYADQAHLSRDFAGLFGEPPTIYAGRYPNRQVSAARKARSNHAW
jgi:AraC-like DNA-binding protein